MQLIGMLDSPYVRRVAISLQLLGLRFEHRSLSVFRSLDEFRLINPVVKAPSLVCHDGTVLMDSSLILDYAEAMATGGRSLMPRDLAERRQVLRRTGLALAACEKAVQVVYEHHLRPAPIPGTTIFDGAQARKGYALNKMCYSFNNAANRAAFLCRRRRLLHAVRPERPAARRHPRAQRAAADRRRRQRLLPGQVRRHLRAGHAGHRRAADRPDQGTVQGQAAWPPTTRPDNERTMARIIGAITTSPRARHRRRHRPQGAARPYWKPFFDGFIPVREWLAEVQPDIVVVVYNDHGLNFFLDKMPTFAVGAAPEYRNADEGWGIPTVPAFPGDLDLSWHLIESLVGEDFDLTTCQEMQVDHAFTLPMALLWPDQAGRCGGAGVHQHRAVPAAQAARCYKLGEAIGRAVASFPGDARVLVLGTGGLSHQLDGERAGFINKDFDLQFMESLTPTRPGPRSTHPRTGREDRHAGGGAGDVAGRARRAGPEGAQAAQRTTTSRSRTPRPA
jgi:protocatechuate 4,5-dioxygenase beta chain